MSGGMRASWRLRAPVIALTSLAAACAGADRPARGGASSAGEVTPAEAGAIAREAYVYLYPMVQNYQTIYQFALDTAGREFKGPLNTIANVARVFTPRDSTIVMANSDTPYSYLMMDLRAEPIVVSLPRIEPDRYYSLQLVDLYTHNVDYLGTRKDGNAGGAFLVAGPGWQGEAPRGVARVVRMPTSLVFGQFRTQLYDGGDLARVKAIQAKYRAEPLSAFLGAAAPPAAPAIDYPAITQERLAADFWRYANFLLQFAPPLAGEEPLRERFARIGVRPGGAWPAPGLSADVVRAVEEGGR
ncbi:MAG TPA: DUF1254 domain-containing protein, partial [Gemmatimonadales bacterium]|nr:DUF1254 domain-containing protein [Gemmatimonadales bacterium]